ncbi:MAG TPA: hypothetical protein DDY68_01675, partial [Porphyromonadaceae bacterium]|nr:hypothetical protein [Porphyromonadaceae bacterium]
MGEFYLLRWLIPLCVGIATENFFSSWYFHLGCILLGVGFVFLYALQKHSYSKYRYKSFPAFA